MKEIVTQTERTSDDFYLAHPDIVQRNGFFRFNVFHGLAEIGLEEYNETAKMADATQHYLNRPEIHSKATLCIEQLCRPSQQGTYYYTCWFPVPPTADRLQEQQSFLGQTAVVGTDQAARTQGWASTE